MALDHSYVGRKYPPTAPYQVGREKIREFATAIGATDPAYHDPGAARALGHPDVVAPPTFPVVLSMAAGEQLFVDPALGIDYSRVVHGDQRFVYLRPVVAGDELVSVITIDEISSRGGHDFLTSRTEISTTAGELVVTVWTKIVVRGEG
ncbi:FAS1-like dehydratase domain-containing protein [Melissospora conviva]|uniref:FAS1-like dehydratase domain-containing protein n=1 Tax=Melissospora conviva TaxID=3388432 RepID=UPI003B82A25C